MSEIDTPVVAKVDGEGGGTRIYCLAPENGRFRFQDQLVDSDWVWKQFEPVISRGFYIEEQASNHPSLQEIYPDSLNTVGSPR